MLKPLIRYGTEAVISASVSASLQDLEVALATDTGKLFIPYNGVKYFIGTGYKKYHYERSECWYQGGSSTATLRRSLYSPNEVEVKIDTVSLKLITQTALDLNTAGSWDTVSGTDYTTAANRAGKDFYIYMCQPVSGTVPVIKISANSTVPSGYSASTSRKVGGFHCLCVSVGTIAGHTLTGYLAGDILPLSVWDLWHRAESGNEGMVYAAGISAWVDIYLQSGTGLSTASVNGATITDTRMQYDHVDDCAAVNKRLLFDHEFTYIATGCNEGTSIAGSADPVTTGGHEGYELMTLDVAPGGDGWSVGDYVIGATSTFSCKIVQVLTSTTYIVKNRTGAFTLDEVLNNSETLTLNVAPAAPGWIVGNTITGASSGKTCVILQTSGDSLTYKVKLRNGDFTLDEILSNGTITADQGAANPTVTTTIAANQGAAFPTFATDTTHGGRLISNIGCEDCVGVLTQWLNDSLTPVQGADYATGVAFGWKDVTGTRGQVYSQGTYGFYKLRAGGRWDGGASCGSRSRSLDGWAWYVAATVGGRALSNKRPRRQVI